MVRSNLEEYEAPCLSMHAHIAGLPEIAFTSGEEAYNYTLSYLPGQRLSACTCPDDETHPGPRNSTTGGFVGRSAPEIDMIEAQVRRSLWLCDIREVHSRIFVPCALTGRSMDKGGACKLDLPQSTSITRFTDNNLFLHLRFPNPLNGLRSTLITSGSTHRLLTRFMMTKWSI
jgi:hypothetical protein